jgi:hypothetical protein
MTLGIKKHRLTHLPQHIGKNLWKLFTLFYRHCYDPESIT